jgi:SAM-dependent methyltransferase
MSVPSGRILDLGSTKKRSSYYSFLRIQDDRDVVSCDLRDADINIDLEGRIPIEEGSFDTVLCFNILEHIFHHGNMLMETARVLKPSGTMIGFTPFLLRVHGSPHDYFRYSATALVKMLSQAGLKEIQVKYIGRGPLLASYSQTEALLPRIAKLPIVFLAMSLDYVLEKIKPEVMQGHYPLGYLFVCKK